MDYGIYINIGTTVAVIVYIIRGTWHARGIETSIREYLDAQIDNMQRDIAKLERSGMETADTLRREFGETGQALRTKIHEVEMWNRDTFVRKDSFEMVISRIEKTMEKGFDKIDSRIETALERFDKRD